MATENLLMAAVAAGGDRQELHERIRQHSLAAAARVKAGGPNDLVARLKADAAFKEVDLEAELEPTRFTGLSSQQVEAFIRDEVQPIRQRHPSLGSQQREIHV